MKKIIGISILTANLMFGVTLGNFADDGGNTGNTAIGQSASATGNASIAIGSSASATGEGSIAIGHSASATGIDGVAIGFGSVADEDFTISVGDDDIGLARRITNVGTPTKDTDATNKKYVDDEIGLSASNTLSSANSYTDSVFSSISMSGGISESEVDIKDQTILNSAKTYADEGDIKTLNKAKSYTDEKYDLLDKKIDTLEQTLTKELRIGVASAIALGVTPVFQNDKDNALGVGFGNYEGESAMAINYARKIASNQVLQLGTSLNAAHRAFKVGYSVSW